MLYKHIDDQADNDSLHKDLDTLLRWESDRKMAFHQAKCVPMTVTLNTQPLKTDYMMRGDSLTEHIASKYLGVTITSKENWKQYVEEIGANAFQTLFSKAFLQCDIHQCPQKLGLFYYGSTKVWNSVLLCSNLMWRRTGIDYRASRARQPSS